MNVRKTVLLSLLLYPLVAVAAMADSITLKDGRAMEGEILTDGSDSILIEYFVTPTIKDQKLVSKNEIVEISIVSPDEKAFRALGSLTPPRTVLDTSFHDQLIERKIPSYLQKYPYSRHLTELREALRSLEGERVALRRGDRRVDGVWIAAATFEEDPYQSGAKLKFEEMKELMQANDPEGSLRAYELIEKMYPGSEVMPDAVDAALKQIDLLQGKIGVARANFDILDKRRQKAIAMAPADQAKEIKDAIERDVALAKKAMAEAIADGTKFFPVFLGNKEALEALQALAVSEMTRLQLLQKSPMREGISAVKEGLALLSEEKLAEAKDRSALAQKLWPANMENAKLAQETELLAKKQAAAAEASKQAAQPASKSPAKP